MINNTTTALAHWVNKKVNGEVILSAVQPKGYDLLLLTTKKRTYCCDLSGKEIENADKWTDHYLEPYSSNFYRMDGRGEWYDIEGHKLSTPIFLIGDVLCSLACKKSIRSLVFKDQPLYVSGTKNLIQIGKIVYNNDLEQVSFFGQRITGLGARAVRFADGSITQEVLLGLNQSAFILDNSGMPFVVDGHTVENHKESLHLGQHDYEVFEGDGVTFTFDGSPDQVVKYEGQAAQLDLSTYLFIDGQEVACHQSESEKIFIDLNTSKPYHIKTLGHRYISGISKEAISVDGLSLYNVKTKDIQCVYIEDTQSIYTIDDDSVQPNSIIDVEGFERHFVFADVGGLKKLVAKKTNKVIRLINDVEITEILGQPTDKLLNARAVDGSSIVIDMRNGIRFASLALVNDRSIIEVFDQPYSLGSKMLQNARIGTLGGSESAVVDLNTSDLSLFTIPSDLREYPEQEDISAFANNPIIELNFNEPITIGKFKFYQGRFQSYMGSKFPILINQDDAQPLHLDGNGHRMELGMELLSYTANRTYRLGEHKILAVATLTEDLKSETLLFSEDTLSSWLPFYDSFLPVFRKVMEMKNATDWPCLLFELRDNHGDKEYIAVEDREPYRLLVENRGDVLKPKIITSKEKVLKTPEQISKLKRIFAKDPGYLIEVE